MSVFLSFPNPSIGLRLGFQTRVLILCFLLLCRCASFIRAVKIRGVSQNQEASLSIWPVSTLIIRLWCPYLYDILVGWHLVITSICYPVQVLKMVRSSHQGSAGNFAWRRWRRKCWLSFAVIGFWYPNPISIPLIMAFLWLVLSAGRFNLAEIS